ncbi:hypothetical protein EDD15DRAFT_2486974 [Pisolithus albus]|nr:hypothetical protein EDD15DRAFT_2486974 [Pisolithus albus]
MSGNAGNESQTQSGGENNHLGESTVRASLDIIGGYRRGSVSKARAIYEIQQALATAQNPGNGENSSEHSDAFLTYLAMLNEIDFPENGLGVPGRGYLSPPPLLLRISEGPMGMTEDRMNTEHPTAFEITFPEEAAALEESTRRSDVDRKRAHDGVEIGLDIRGAKRRNLDGIPKPLFSLTAKGPS